MGYQAEDLNSRELFSIQIVLGSKIVTEYIWAYTIEEATQKAIDRGLILAL